MAVHAEDALRGTRIPQILDFLFAISALEAVGAECLVSRQDGQILNLVPAAAATVCAVVTDQRSITEEEQVRVGVKEGAAGVTPEAVDMPSVASYKSTLVSGPWNAHRSTYPARMPCPLPGPE